jgi:hypothetical protein
MKLLVDMQSIKFVCRRIVNTYFFEAAGEGPTILISSIKIKRALMFL